MRIAVVIERFNPHAGGAERSTAQIVAELVKRGHEVTLLCGRTSVEELPGVELRPLAHLRLGTGLGFLAFARAAEKALEEGRFDVSLSVNTAVRASVIQPRGGTIRETLIRTAAARPTPLGRSLKQAAIAVTPKYWAQLKLERQTLADPRVRRIVAVSEYVSDQLTGHYQVAPERIEIIPNAAVMPKATAEERAGWREAVRSGLGIGEGAVVYLFAAQNPRLKGYTPFLKALARLEERGVEAVGLLAGELWYANHAEAVRLGVRDRVRFVRQTRTMPPLYAAADATVLPTFYDPASKVVIESLMMGTPAISTGYNGASDFIEPESGGGHPRGVVVPEPDDVAGLADAMAKLADGAYRRRCAEACAGLGDGLSMARHVDQLERVLSQVAAEPVRGGE